MLSQDNLKRIANFDPTALDQLREATNDTDTMSAAGAVTLATYHTKLAVSGTMAFTLANGTVAGQRKRISCESAASIPAGTLTVTTPDATTGYACQATFFFDTPGQMVELLWTGTAWRATRVERAGGTANNVVVGTTVLNTNPLWSAFYLSVTGTVSSTTTKGIPNGSAVGEVIQVSCSTAASIPSGTISITAKTLLGAASTTLGTVAATTNLMTLRWDGQAWTQVGASVTLALS